MNESNHESKKITWTQILRAVIQAAIAALTALGITSCASSSKEQTQHFPILNLL